MVGRVDEHIVTGAGPCDVDSRGGRRCDCGDSGVVEAGKGAQIGAFGSSQAFASEFAGSKGPGVPPSN